MSTTVDTSELEEQIDAAQNRWRTRSRGTPMMVGGNAPIRIDPEARADMLDRGLEVQAAAIHLDQLKQQRAEARLAELTDPATLAPLEAARDEAQEALRASEALKLRHERAKTMRDEIARAQAAIRGAEALQAKEQAQRDELASLTPSASGRVVARAG